MGEGAVAPPAAARGGLVLVDKEAGPSSFSVVQRLRARFGVKAGHAGTLDPFATGLLLVLVGSATRLARYVVGLDKRYVAEIHLGARTSTGDLDGGRTETTTVPSREEIEALRGTIELPVPSASAVKIGGRRAYELHRRGIEVEMPIRRSTIHDLVVRRFEPPLLELELVVSSGTYVRAVADRLGGHCTSLCRTAVGPFPLEGADESRVLPPLEAVRFLPRRNLEADEASLVRSGRPVDGVCDGPIALVRHSALVAVGRPVEGLIRPETVIS